MADIVEVEFRHINLADMQRVEIVEIKEVESTLIITCTPANTKHVVYQARIKTDSFPALSAKLVLNKFAIRQESDGMILAIKSGAVRA